ANPEHEQRVAELVRRRLPEMHVSLSSEIWPEYGEYERGAATVISSYVGSNLSRYLERLEHSLREIGVRVPLQIMQSSGGAMMATDGGRRAVYAIESGPAAGVMAAAHVGRTGGYNRLLAFDMGGTTAKVGLVEDGQPRITQSFRVGGKASTGQSAVGEPIKI